MDVATSITGKIQIFFLKLVGEMSEGGQKRETGYEINRCGECTARIAPLVDNVVLSI